MITDHLFDKILIEPVHQGANQLYVVSGYATSAMVFAHFEKLVKFPDLKINLVVGMSSYDGLSLTNHRGFQELATVTFHNRFLCHYVSQLPAVHSKVYTWCKDGIPIQAFLGSANYTQMAFNDSTRREAMEQCDSLEALDYYNMLTRDTINCIHADVESTITLYNDTYFHKVQRQKQIMGIYEENVIDDSLSSIIAGLPHVRFPVFKEKHNVSGLNWGQRDKRNRNEAYLALPSKIGGSDFFPPRAIHFTVQTDDNRVFVCTRAQDGDKAIETPHNNSLLGEYFRYRLGLPSGAKVTKEDLERYGRTDVDFYKLDEETYYMDFSPKTNQS